MDKSLLQSLRREYRLAQLHEGDLQADPIQQFGIWFTEALDSGVYEPSAMTLATSTKDGKPSVRMVLLKEYSQHGFVFYTNYLSRKGGEMEENPQVALLFFWPELERQIRIEGSVEKISQEKSEKYFQSRPKGSQLGALVSPQSQIIQTYAELEQKLFEFEAFYHNTEIKKPAHWGGYQVKPEAIEFWQGRANRLHDRIAYQKQLDGWKSVRLAP